MSGYPFEERTRRGCLLEYLCALAVVFLILMVAAWVYHHPASVL